MSVVRKGVYVLPNLFTLGNLFCGFLAVVKAIDVFTTGDGRYTTSALLIGLAAFFDGMDGRVARRTNTASKFGIELDSLCDLVSFGMAPALICYLWSFKTFGRMGWLGSFLFLACTALRLARFNVQVDTVERKYFQGLPCPMAALVIMSSVLLFEGKPIYELKFLFSKDVAFYLLCLSYVLSLLMVSIIPYPSFKSVTFAKTMPFQTLLLMVLAIMALATKPTWGLFCIALAYMLWGPLAQTLRLVGLLPPLAKPKPVVGGRSRRRRRRRGLRQEEQFPNPPNVKPLKRKSDSGSEGH